MALTLWILWYWYKPKQERIKIKSWCNWLESHIQKSWHRPFTLWKRERGRERITLVFDTQTHFLLRKIIRSCKGLVPLIVCHLSSKCTIIDTDYKYWVSLSHCHAKVLKIDVHSFTLTHTSSRINSHINVNQPKITSNTISIRVLHCLHSSTNCYHLTFALIIKKLSWEMFVDCWGFFREANLMVYYFLFRITPFWTTHDNYTSHSTFFSFCDLIFSYQCFFSFCFWWTIEIRNQMRRGKQHTHLMSKEYLLSTIFLFVFLWPIRYLPAFIWSARFFLRGLCVCSLVFSFGLVGFPISNEPKILKRSSRLAWKAL